MASKAATDEEVARLRAAHRDAADIDSAGDLMLALNNLAADRFGDGRADDAVALIREAIDVGEAVPGPVPPEHLPLAATLVNLAEIHRQTGDPRQALEPLRRAASLLRADGGSTDLRARVLTDLTRLHLSNEDPHAAWPFAEEALTIVPHDDRRGRLTALILWAAAAEGREDFGSARLGLEQAIEIEAGLNDGSPQAVIGRANLINRLGRCHLALEDFSAAIDVLSDVLNLCDRLGGADAPPAVTNLCAAARNRIGRAYKASGEIEQAETHLRASVSMMREIARSQPTSDVIEDLATALRDLGEILIAGGRTEEGQRLMAEYAELTGG